MPPRRLRAAALAMALALVVKVTGCASGPGAKPAAVRSDAAGMPDKSGPQRQAVVVPVQGDAAETTIALPAFPADADLVELRQRGRADLKFFVDARSVEVAVPGEIRYTLVVRSATGGRMVTFEAMRCDERERLIVATGSPDGKWVPARFLRWEPLDRNDMLGQRAVLYKDMFCPDQTPIEHAKEGVAALRSGMHPRAKGI